jgi:hypothetical protein
MLAVTRGTITKRHHTDNAKEQISAAIGIYLHATRYIDDDNFPTLFGPKRRRRTRDSHSHNPRPL